MPRYLTIDSPSAGQHHKESCIMAPRMLLWAKEPVLNTALQSVGSQHPSSLCTSSHNLWNPFLPTLIRLFSKAESPLTASSVLGTESHIACLYFKASKRQKKKKTQHPKNQLFWLLILGAKRPSIVWSPWLKGMAVIGSWPAQHTLLPCPLQYLEVFLYPKLQDINICKSFWVFPGRKHYRRQQNQYYLYRSHYYELELHTVTVIKHYPGGHWKTWTKSCNTGWNKNKKGGSLSDGLMLSL